MVLYGAVNLGAFFASFAASQTDWGLAMPILAFAATSSVVFLVWHKSGVLARALPHGELVQAKARRGLAAGISLILGGFMFWLAADAISNLVEGNNASVLWLANPFGVVLFSAVFVGFSHCRGRPLLSARTCSLVGAAALVVLAVVGLTGATTSLVMWPAVSMLLVGAAEPLAVAGALSEIGRVVSMRWVWLFVSSWLVFGRVAALASGWLREASASSTGTYAVLCASAAVAFFVLASLLSWRQSCSTPEALRSDVHRKTEDSG